MAGFIHCVRFRTPTGYVTSGAGAADSSFPHANAADITHPHRPWKSASAISVGTTFYGVDFGSAVQVAAVAIDNTNVTSVTIQAASDSAFTTDVLTVTPVLISENQVERSLFTTSAGLSLGRLKVFANLDGTNLDSQSRQYWRIIPLTASVDADDDTFIIGSVAWCRTLTEWANGVSSYDETPLESTRPNDDYVGGGRDPVTTGNPHAAVALSASPASRADMRSDVLTLLRQGLGRPFLFYKNDSDTSDFYICYRANDVTLKQTSPTVMEVTDFIAESAV